MHVRSLFALVVAALLAGPAAAHAQAKKSSAKAAPAKATAPATTTTTAGALAAQPSVDVWIGYESDEASGFQLRGDYVWPYKVLAPNFDLSFVGAVGISRISDSVTTPGLPPLVPATTADTSVWIFKVIPTARFTYTFPQDRRFSVFGDAGLGLSYDSVSTDVTGLGSSSDSSLGVTLRLGVGGFFRVDPKWQLGATVVYDPTSGTYGFDTWSILAGAKFAL